MYEFASTDQSINPFVDDDDEKLCLLCTNINDLWAMMSSLRRPHDSEDEFAHLYDNDCL